MQLQTKAFYFESFFLHDSALNYKEKSNLLKEKLAPGASISEKIPTQVWYVTVFRQPHKKADPFHESVIKNL